MARYSLFVLKVLLNPKQTNKQTLSAGRIIHDVFRANLPGGKECAIWLVMYYQVVLQHRWEVRWVIIHAFKS